MIKNNGRNSSKRRAIIIAGAALLLTAVAAFALEKSPLVNFEFWPFRDKIAQQPYTAATTSDSPTAQEDFSAGDDRPVLDTGRQEGTVEDTEGNVSDTPPASQWLSSSDGSITVYSPGKDGLIKSGDTLSGSSALSRVSFRIIDDVSGVIAQGSLAVVEGKFSGIFDFSTTGKNGRLDVYDMSSDGTESSNIEIPVTFK